jgi:hypothetical protein
MNTLSLEAQRAVEESAARSRLHAARYGVRFTVILSDPGTRMRRAGQEVPLRAAVAGSDGTINYISADADGLLHCTCRADPRAGGDCAHLNAYTRHM